MTTGVNAIIRQIIALSGPCIFATQLHVAPDYARVEPNITLNQEGAIATGPLGAFVLALPEPDMSNVSTLQTDGNGSVSGHHTLDTGEQLTIILGWAAHPYQASQLRQSFQRDWTPIIEETRLFWAGWSAQTVYSGPYRDLVARSAVTLKLLTYAPTGAIVAAPTTSLPEHIGGTRNWDYRYTWVRDGSLTADVLAMVGHREEAQAFLSWMEHRERASENELRTMYAILGNRHLPEFELATLEGYRGSRPVRIGNGAAEQTQLDIYGEWLHFVTRLLLLAETPPPEPWLQHLITSAVAFICDHWMDPDSGIWEIRSEPQHFIYSQVMCWVAVDRGITLAEHFGWQVDRAHWLAIRETIHAAVCANGIDAGTGGFKISYESGGIDAASLLIPLVGFLPHDDARVIATVDAIVRPLDRGGLAGTHGLIYRYRQTELDMGFDDGVGGAEGTFVICSCWLAECLALLGREDEATTLFEQMAQFAGSAGLLSEMIDPDSGELLGNYPQAFSHLGMIRVAMGLATIPATSRYNKNE